MLLVSQRRSFSLAILASLAVAPLAAQDSLQKSHWESVSLRSGIQTNPTPVEGVVYRDFITLPPSTPWLRVAFAGAVLPKGSYVRIVAVSNGDSQTMRQGDLVQADNMSAFFYGNAVMVELVAGPNTPKNSIEIDKVMAGDVAIAFPPVAQQLAAVPVGYDGPEDECTGAIAVVPGLNGPFSNVGATASAPAYPCGFGPINDIWFRLVAPCTGDYTFSTCTPARTVDTVLEVFSGGCGSLTSLGCNDDGLPTCTVGSSPTSFASTLTLTGLSAGTYYIRVGGYNGATGDFELRITSSCHNDECTGSFPLGLGNNGPFSSLAATTSAPVWPCVFNGGADCWFTYNAPCAIVTFETCGGSNFDTGLQVFTGGCGALTSIGCNDDNCGLQSRVTVQVPTAQTLWIRVGGFNLQRGTFVLNVSQSFPNEDCTGALVVNDGLNGPYCTTGASTSFSWPCAVGGSDLWYQYTASCTGILSVTTCTPARNYDTALQIFSGPCNGLNSLQCNDDTGGACGLGSTLTVPVTQGTTYYIRLGGFNSNTGTAELNISCVHNDECTQAIPIGLGQNGTYTNAPATASAPAWTCGFGTINDCWFYFDATCTAPHTFSTCTPNRTVDTVLRVFDACGGTLMGCNDDGGGCTTGSPPTAFASSLTVNLNAGSRYYVCVGGYNGATGNFDIVASTGTGTGNVALFSTSACASTATLAVTGDLNIGGYIQADVTGGTGFVLTGFGFSPLPIPAPCSCNVITDGGGGLGYFEFTSSRTLLIPCDASLIGFQLDVQGDDVFTTSGGCTFAGLPFGLTDIYRVTIG